MAHGARPQLEAQVHTRQVLAGRLAAAKWISMTEPEVSREVKELESDPLFQELAYGLGGAPAVVRRRRWPASQLHGGFYDFNEAAAAETGSADIQDLVERHRELIALIRRVGRESFERYFLYGEESKPLPVVCKKLGLTLEEGRRILDLVLEVGSRSEFFRPAAAARADSVGYHMIARIERDPREQESLYFQFLSPHWARGRYEVAYDKLEEWKRTRGLAPEERRRLRRLLKSIELLNMRQNTLFQILSRITSVQAAFLNSRQGHRRRPLSLRELARRIGVAPSTVSRAVARRSVELPWGEEVPLKSLLTGQRAVVLSVLGRWMEKGEVGPRVTDEALMRRLAGEAGIAVSRRTVNECRRLLHG